jgi:hypothetical protein
LSKIIAELQKKTVSQLSDLVNELLVDVDKDVFSIPAGDRTEVNFGFDEQINRLFNVLQGKVIEKDPVEEIINFNDLTLVLEEDMDVLVAVDGMVAAARNKILGPYISFNTRLNSLLEDDQVNESNNPLDPSNILEAFKESTLALGMSADRSLLVFRRFSTIVLGGLLDVLESANQVLIDHGILPELGDEPMLSPVRASGRVIPRSHVEDAEQETSTFGMAQSEPVASVSHQQTESNTPLFNMMQNLMYGAPGSPPSSPGAIPDGQAAYPPGGIPAGQAAYPPGAIPAGQAAYPPGATPGGHPAYSPGAVPGAAIDARQRNYVIPAEMLSPDLLSTATTAAPPADQTVEVIDQKQLGRLLSNIQNTLANLPEAQPGLGPPGVGIGESPSIKESLAEMLQEEQEEGVVNAVDRQSHDVIHLVTMLYEAIWQDDAVPIPIKELIGRTQITIVQVALTDTDFFNQEDHPARALLNEFALAGIGWSEVDDLGGDSLYNTMSEFVQRVLNDYDGDVHFFEELLAEFKNYRAKDFAKGRRLEQRILHAQEGKTREEYAQKLVTQRVEERILGRELDPFVSELLEGNFHQFLVLLVLKEGPGSKAWKQAMNTIDVLLWSVQPHEYEEDRERLDTINPRLIGNLQRALRIAKIEAETIDATLTRLQQVQQASFSNLDDALVELDKMLESEDMVFEGMEVADGSATDTPTPAPEMLEEGDENLETVDALGVGTWFEFAIEEDQNVRCKLAARINAIDKFIFVNRQGVKVLEKNRMGLALEFKEESVREISDGLLFSRALETVIGNLRETQSDQRSAGAYQPEAT